MTGGRKTHIRAAFHRNAVTSAFGEKNLEKSLTVIERIFVSLVG
jgi:hypothetical protein